MATVAAAGRRAATATPSVATPTATATKGMWPARRAPAACFLQSTRVHARPLGARTSYIRVKTWLTKLLYNYETLGPRDSDLVS